MSRLDVFSSTPASVSSFLALLPSLDRSRLSAMRASGVRSRDDSHLAVPHRGIVPRVRHEYPAQRVPPDAVQERVPGEGPGEIFVDLFTNL